MSFLHSSVFFFKSVKTVSTIFLVSLLNSSIISCQDKIDSTLENEKIKGNVSKITENYYDLRVNSSQTKIEEFTYKVVTIYSKEGVMVKQTQYNEKGEVDDLNEYFYDDKNCLARKTWKRFNNILPDFKRTLVVDMNYTFVCDEDGKVIEENQYDLKGGSAKDLYLKSFYEYNSEGKRKSGKRYFYPSKELSETIDYKYNSKKQLIEKVILFKDGRLNWRETYKYDDNQLVSEYNDFSDKGLFISYKARYDNLDKHGNWQTSIKSNKEDYEMVKREIEYY